MNIFSIKKKSIITRSMLLTLNVLLFSLLLAGAMLFADTNGTDRHGKPLDAVLQEIREKQGLEPDEPIDPRAISEADLEELGEAVMSVMHPDPKQHEFMDNMMGGEGSWRLARMHRRIGYNYITGKSGLFEDNMMDPVMMGEENQRGGMMEKDRKNGDMMKKDGQRGGMTGNSMM